MQKDRASTATGDGRRAGMGWGWGWGGERVSKRCFLTFDRLRRDVVGGTGLDLDWTVRILHCTLYRAASYSTASYSFVQLRTVYCAILVLLALFSPFWPFWSLFGPSWSPGCLVAVVNMVVGWLAVDCPSFPFLSLLPSPNFCARLLVYCIP
mgnify:CR=1 FL=1